MESGFACIGRQALFARLAEGHAARVTVVTPNSRLAQAVQRGYDESRAAEGLAAWEAPDILPLGAFLQRMWEDALYAGMPESPPLLLAPAQELALWEDSIRASHLGEGLLSASAAARPCREAWNLVHAWGIAGRISRAACSDDAHAFLDWSSRYARATRQQRQTDAARLPDVLSPLLAHEALRKPRTLVLFGFDLLTPQQRGFIAALAAQGVAVLASEFASHAVSAGRLEFTAPEDELAAAARWARSRLEADGRARIGIVVPDLGRSRSRVRRALASVMVPFNLSLGLPLTEYPLVRDALLSLRLTGPEVTFEEASRLVRSPFLAGAEAEMAARARFDAWLREHSSVAMTLDRLVQSLARERSPKAPILAERLGKLAEFRKEKLFGAALASDWARAFSRALGIAGFPGERASDSAEYQLWKKWHEVLAEFALLDRVTGKMRHAQACSRLARLASDTLFQPETPDVPIQVMGILESAGLEFNHLWVMGLTDEAWPLPARPNPFVPLALQREAGVPQADPSSSLALDRRITQGWLGAAAEVVVSHARMEGECELAASPLIAQLPAGDFEAMGLPHFTSPRDTIHGARAFERLSDTRAPALGGARILGGTSIFRDQAACPFRAFAGHRLGAKPLETPQPGLDPRDRGTLLHQVLASAWIEIKDKARLDALAESELAALLERCVKAALERMRARRPEVLRGRFAEIERDRLVSLAREWLAFEKTRPDFTVVSTEEKRPVTFGGVTVNVKLDRMDELAQGGYALLDYKTGNAAVNEWLRVPPDEPQLPLYASASEREVRAVAYARVKKGEVEFCGLAAAEGLLPRVVTIAKNQSAGARRYADWSALRKGWKAALEQLGRDIAAGEARVDPRNGAKTCAICAQHPFCRIAEKQPALAGGADE